MREKESATQTLLSIQMEGEVSPRVLSKMMLVSKEIYTECWLISKQRTRDLIEYRKTLDPKFEKGTGFIIQAHWSSDVMTGERSYNRPLLEMQVPRNTSPQLKQFATDILKIAFPQDKPK